MKLVLWNLVPLALLLVLVVGVLVFTAAFTLVERKLMGLHQRREGPDRVGFEGLGQPFADGLKLLRKETLLPKDSPERRVFFLAPLLSLWVSLLLWTLVPLSPAGSFVAEETGLLLVLGLSSLGSYGVIYAGWASNNKYALLGAFRAVAQFISYEIVFSLLFLPLIGVTGSANLQSLVNYQVQEGWFSYLVPLWGLSFLVILAETNRTPFDLPEAEAELVAGFNVEYSSLLFAFFFLAEYSAMGFFGALLVTLFFGGYSLMPFGWGRNGNRPLDDFDMNNLRLPWSSVWLTRQAAKADTEREGCLRPPRNPELWNQRFWPLEGDIADSVRKLGFSPKLASLNDNVEFLYGTAAFWGGYRGPSRNAPHSPYAVYDFAGHALNSADALFNSHGWAQMGSPIGAPPHRIYGLERLYLGWDWGLLNPFNPDDSPWVALMPALLGVPVLALKVQLLCVTFILVRASLPRLRFDQLTLLCWKYLFPLALGGSLLVMGLHYGFTLCFLALETRTQHWLPVFIQWCSDKDCIAPGVIRDLKMVWLKDSNALLFGWDVANGYWNSLRLSGLNQIDWWTSAKHWNHWTTQPDWLWLGPDAVGPPGVVAWSPEEASPLPLPLPEPPTGPSDLPEPPTVPLDLALLLYLALEHLRRRWFRK